MAARGTARSPHQHEIGVSEGLAAGTTAQGRRAADNLSELLVTYGERGAPIDVSFRDLVGPISVNDLSHSVYPYPARLLRQIPRFFLHCEQLVGSEGSVMDPFCGSGTVLVEARAAGIDSIGIDSNPFARLLTRVKTTPIEAAEANRSVETVMRAARSYRSRGDGGVVNVDLWYSPQASTVLSKLQRAILHGEHSAEIREFLLVALAVVGERASARDLRIPVPVRRKDWREHCLAQRSDDVWTSFRETALDIGRRLSALPGGSATSRVVGDDACDAHEAVLNDGHPVGRPSLVITSPPYGAAQKYVRSTSLALGWTGLANPSDLAGLERLSIGREHLRNDEINAVDPPTSKIASELEEIQASAPRRAAIYNHYFREMDNALRSASLAIRPSGHLVLVAGSNSVDGKVLATHTLLAHLAERHGFTQVLELRDAIRGRSLLTKRRSLSAPLHSEHVHVMRRTGE